MKPILRCSPEIRPDPPMQGTPGTAGQGTQKQ